MPRSDRWNDLAERYVSGSGQVLAGAVAAATLELLQLSPGLRVLDLGCGPGTFARHIAEFGCEVTGIDSSPALLTAAREAERAQIRDIEYIEAGATDPRLLHARSYDRVLASMSIADIDDLEATLANVARLLKPGIFVLSSLHPCFPGHGDSLSSWPPSGYYSEGWWLAEGHHGYRGVVGANHRMLATYVNALVARGFTITAMREPAPDTANVPMFLVLQATVTPPVELRGRRRLAWQNRWRGRG